MVVVGFVDKVAGIVAEANQQISPVHYFNDISELRSTIFEKDNAESLLVLFEFLGTTKADLITQIELIERAIPHAKIVVVSGSADAKIIVEALRLRVLGFISNSTPIKKVLDIIGHLDQVTVLCQKTRETLANHFTLNKSSLLTDRETEVLELLAQGLTFVKIGDTLSIGIETVKTHIRHIYEKLDARGKVHALEIARANRLIA